MSGALFTACPCLLPVITNPQPSRTFKNWHAWYFALSTALPPSMVARQKSIHSRDVSTQQHLWLNTMREKYMCSFICKEEILCSTLEQNRARSFTRSLLSLHLLQKYIKSLHIFNISIFGSFRTTETYNSFDEKPGKAEELCQI